MSSFGVMHIMIVVVVVVDFLLVLIELFH